MLFLPIFFLGDALLDAKLPDRYWREMSLLERRAKQKREFEQKAIEEENRMIVSLHANYGNISMETYHLSPVVEAKRKFK